VSKVQDEVNIESPDTNSFDINNPRTWSKDSITHIEDNLKANEIPVDGLVCLFGVTNDDTERDIDFDEVAWEIEKAVVYHSVTRHSQRLLNPEGRMSRQGVDPVSRKVKTPGRNRRGYMVYLAYQLVESVTCGQVIMDTVYFSMDISSKKKQLLHQLGDLKMSPPVDDRNRRLISDVKEFMKKDQLEILHLVREVKDQGQLSAVLQLLHLLQSGQSKGDLEGLNKFVSFLSQQDSPVRSTSKQSTGSEGVSRPLSRSNSARSRKPSSSSFSSISTTSSISRCNSSCSLRGAPSTPVRKVSRANSKRLSSLAAIQSDEESEKQTTTTTEQAKRKSKSVQENRLDSSVVQKTSRALSSTENKLVGSRKGTRL